MHEIERTGLDQHDDPDNFFADWAFGAGAENGQGYIGGLNRLLHARAFDPALVMNVATLCATYLPAADQVIRDDVGTPGHLPPNCEGDLLFYVGVPVPIPGQGNGNNRGQFLAFAMVNDELRCYVAGTGRNQTLNQYINDLNPHQRIHGYTLTHDELGDFENLLAGVAGNYNHQIYVSKGGVVGRIPSTWGRHMQIGEPGIGAEDARARAVAEWNLWRAAQNLTHQQARQIWNASGRDGRILIDYVVSYVRQGWPVGDALQFGLINAGH